MFSRLSVLATIAHLALVNALLLTTPSDVFVGSSLTITWQAQSGDTPSFSLFLHHPSFHSDFALANNVGTSDGQTTFTVPGVLPQDDYTIRATPNNNVTDTLAVTNPFAISTATSTVSQTSIPSTSSTTSSSTTTTSSNSTTTSSNSTSTRTSSTSTTPFGTTLTSPITTPGSSTTTPVTTPTNTSSNTAVPTNFNNAALPAKFAFNGVGLVALVISIVAGASIVA